MSPKDLDSYLLTLNLPSTIEKKIRATLSFYIDNKLIDPISIFVNQDKDDDQNIRANRLWMFDNNYCAEADISNGKIAGDIATIKSRIRRYEFSASDSNFDEPELSGYLKIHASMLGGLACRFQAFGKNRRVLWDLFTSHIKPNVIGQ
jgi:hypothetical protein